MQALLVTLRTSVLLTLVFAVVLCGAYPLVVWAGGQVFFSHQANGSLVTDRDGTVRGSALLAQSFTGESYFHPRPSAAGTGYDAASSGGTNLGPTSRKLADRIQAAIADYRKTNDLAAAAVVPADAVTSSGSGLDPHISAANAELQAPRVARARGLPLERVRAVLQRSRADRQWGVFGEPRVNVLELNLALDATVAPAPRSAAAISP